MPVMSMFREGGFWMYPIVGLGVLFFAVAVTVGLFRSRFRVPAAVVILPALILALMAAYASYSGLAMADDALSNALPEMKQSLAASGISQAIFTAVAGGSAVFGVLIGAMFATALGSALHRGGRWTLSHALPPLLCGGIALGPALFGYDEPNAMLTLLVMVATVASVVAGVRASDKSAPLSAESRGHVALYAMLAAAAVGTTLASIEITEVLRAVAGAPANAKEEMLLLGLDEVRTWPSAVVAVALGLGGVGAMIPVAKGLLSVRTAVGVLAASSLALLTSAALAYGPMRVDAGFRTFSEKAGESAIAELERGGVRLPALDSDRELELAVRVSMSRSSILVDWEPVVRVEDGQFPPDEIRGLLLPSVYDVLLDKVEMAKELGRQSDITFDGRLQLAVDSETRWSTLEPVVYTANKAGFSVPTFVGVHTDELVGVTAHLLGDSVRPDSDKVELLTSKSRPAEWAAPGEQIYVRVDPSVTVEELAQALCALRCGPAPLVGNVTLLTSGDLVER